MIPTEKLSLLVLKSRYELWVLLGGVYIRSFGVGLGKDDKTPEGRFTVETKKKNPDWYRGGRVIPYGSPENQLGTRWLGFKRTPQAAGYGIHGTDRPDSIGKAVSEGCIRMRNEDVEELFEWVSEGTEVVIVR
jgi:lipoprotein-anchoring transpeptidase ErfK/SrfK